MKKLVSKCERKALKLYNKACVAKLRKGDGGVFVLILGAAVGTLVIIGFYLVAKNGLGTWSTAFNKLVSM